MTNEILAHTYLKQSCLQVFLYTDVATLILDAASSLLDSSHEEPCYVVVPSSSCAQSLKKALQKLQGFTGFIKIGVLSEIIQPLLGPDLILYDQVHLSLHLFDLLKKGEPSLKALLPKNFSTLDQDLFELSEVLALELLDLIDQGERQEAHQSLFEALAHPGFCFIDEALAKLKSQKLIWVGFATIPSGYLKALQTSQSAFCLVPSSIFLGDVLTPKARLKLLQKQSYLKTVMDDEHPLLASFTQRYRQFYNLCSDALEFVETRIEGFSALHELQQSMQEGLMIEPVIQDQSIVIYKASSPYQEVMHALSFLQERQELLLTQKDILILCSDSALYEPLLNALGDSLKEPVSFSLSSKPHLLWQLIDKMLLAECRDHDFFIDLVTRLSYLQKGSSHFSKDLEILILNAHRATLGAFSLTALKEALLRASVFDLDEEELPHEPNFLSPANFDDLEALIAKLDELIQLVECADELRIKSVPITQWLMGLSKLLDEPPLKELCPFEFYKILIQLQTKFASYSCEMDLACFMKLISAHFSFKEDSPGGCIEIMDMKQMPHRSYKVIVMLGMNPQLPKRSHQLLSQAQTLCELFSYPLWFFQAKSALFMSYLEGYPDLSVVESHPWLQAVQSMMLEQKSYTSFLDSLSFSPRVKNEFFSEDLSVKLTELISLQDTYELDLTHIKSFLKDPEEWIKKHDLYIKDSSELLNKDIGERQLLLYLLQKEMNLGANYDSPLDDFKELMQEKREERYLRSSLVDKEDQLSHIKILSPLELEYENQLHFKLTGLSEASLEHKVAKQLKKLELLCLLQDFLRRP